MSDLTRTRRADPIARIGCQVATEPPPIRTPPASPRSDRTKGPLQPGVREHGFEVEAHPFRGEDVTGLVATMTTYHRQRANTRMHQDTLCCTRGDVPSAACMQALAVACTRTHRCVHAHALPPTATGRWTAAPRLSLVTSQTPHEDTSHCTRIEPPEPVTFGGTTWIDVRRSKQPGCSARCSATRRPRRRRRCATPHRAQGRRRRRGTEQEEKESRRCPARSQKVSHAAAWRAAAPLRLARFRHRRPRRGGRRCVEADCCHSTAGSTHLGSVTRRLSHARNRRHSWGPRAPAAAAAGPHRGRRCCHAPRRAPRQVRGRAWARAE